ncbi:MAG TPA: TonB-dependent receptor [Sphingomonas sp.]|nr:TonB-dependent receptor [Sphingomonas sp.]
MSYHVRGALVGRALLPVAIAAGLSPCHAEEPQAVIVIGQRPSQPLENAPSTHVAIDAATIAATINAANVEDTLKYLPSLVIRKRHIGDTQSPLATRTSGVGASARSLIYADGALLSSLIGNNNTSASPRWSMVTPQEIARIDVLYGPFSAAYPGNSIGAVVNITTRLPDKLEATASAGTSLQTFRQYGTDRDLPAWRLGATVGDRTGRFAWFLSADHVDGKSQPLAYVTAARSTGGTVTGGYDDVDRRGNPIRVLGAGGFEHQRQTNAKLKLALDLAPEVRLSYVGGLFLNDTAATAQTYQQNAAGSPFYTPAFSTNVYVYDERHWSHALSARGDGGAFDWEVIGTLYRFDRDRQSLPTGLLPGAEAGGAGNITRLDGTGWETFDAKAAWHAGAHLVSFGAHWDRFTLDSDRYATDDWRHGGEGARNLASHGRTRTGALWLQDAWTLAAPLTLTIGGRYEDWRAYDGFNFSAAPALSVRQPLLSASRFSPKASLAWTPGASWKVTASFGRAWRFPTVGELYQVVTTGPTLSVPDPNLRPERATSEELAINRGGIRLSLFNEVIDDALLSQTAPVNGGTILASYVQNVDRVRTRGIELAFDRHDLLPRLDLSGSVTLVDPKILADAAFPIAIGKRPPQVPRRKATLVATYRPSGIVSLTAAARYSSRSFGTIDNSDIVTHTWQGFEDYLVADVRAVVKLTGNWSLAAGVDNFTNRKYYLFHPFPQRTFVAEANWKL